MTAVARDLGSVEVAGGELARTCVMVDNNEVVVFHKDHPILKPRFKSFNAWKEFLDGSHGDPVFEVEDEQWRWSKASPASFNCHALSIGSLLGLGPGDWLEGSASEFTLGNNPARILLDTFFEETQVWDQKGDLDIESLSENDVIILDTESSGDIVVSGTIRWIEDKLMIVSKLGEHPVVIVTLSVLLREYAGQFSHVRFYRLRS